MHSSQRTDKAIDCLWSADVWDVGEHPIQDEDLCDGRYDGGDHLHREEDSWWNLHVMTKFEVCREFDSLGGRDIAICYEDHVGDRSTWKNSTANELADEIDAAVLICDGHDDADGNEENRADAKGKNQSIPWKMNWVAGKMLANVKAVERVTYYSTTKMPTASMMTNVARYQISGASLYLFINRL